MLSYGRRAQHPGEMDVEQFHNFYERLVLEEILRTESAAHDDEEFRADVACVALNHLPPRYVRHDVDMSFFLSPQEYIEIEKKISKAVKKAVYHVRHNRGRQPN